jgi:hypothetical protein
LTASPMNRTPLRTGMITLVRALMTVHCQRMMESDRFETSVA